MNLSRGAERLPPHPGRAKLYERTCPYCTEEFLTSHPQSITCGDVECKRKRQRDRCLEWQRAYAEKNGQWANAKYRVRKTGTSCIDCGAPTRGGRGPETRCRKCGRLTWKERARVEARRTARRRRAEKKLTQAAEGVSRGWVFVSGPCHSCGMEFVCQQTNAPAKFCSRTCSRRENKAIRRARQKAVRISPGRRHAVFVRDGWMCRICGDPVNRSAQVPELDAPVVDHRIPLARGGAHAPENWQTAHFYCNSVKCDQLDYDFAEEVS